jgi:competence protein ComEA
LETLPGIGPVIAARIVEDRAANGHFGSAQDLLRVSGIGEKKLAGIADRIVVR